jgi:hypothetical protein
MSSIASLVGDRASSRKLIVLVALSLALPFIALAQQGQDGEGIRGRRNPGTGSCEEIGFCFAGWWLKIAMVWFAGVMSCW